MSEDKATTVTITTEPVPEGKPLAPGKTVGQRLNPVPLIVALVTMLSGMVFLYGLVHTFLAMPEHLQDKIIDNAPALGALAIPAAMSVAGWFWSTFLGPIMHPKAVS